MAIQSRRCWCTSNAVNAAGLPNENFARELMELFTLGIGNYTESDVDRRQPSLDGAHARSDRFDVRVRTDAARWGAEDVHGRHPQLGRPEIIARDPASQPRHACRLPPAT